MTALKDAIPALCMFFAGLILLIPHRIGMSRVNYVIKRYNLPISRAGLLLYKYHNNIELSLLLGTFPMVVIICLFALTGTPTSPAWNKIPIRVFMITFLFFMLLSSINMYIIYIDGGDFGHLDAFYFSLIYLTLFDGFANACAFAINGKFSSMLSAGIPLSGFLVTLLHNIYKFFSDVFHWDDFDYHVLRLQLFINILILSVTLILWIVDICENASTGGHNKLSSGSLWNIFKTNPPQEDNRADWSPILMLAISLGTVYAFYPSIAPYSIIDFQYASVIELWILVISALLPLIMAILDFASDSYTFKGAGQYGPSGVTINVSGSYTYKCWYTSGTSTEGLGYGWHCFWICAIPYILCIQIFMSFLHYPDSLLSSFFNNKYLIGFISVLFNTLREVMQACGFAGAGKQVKARPSGVVNASIISCSNPGQHSANCDMIRNQYKWTTNPSTETQVDGVIAPCNKLLTLFVMMFCVFTGDGYLQHYRRCCRDCWPTTGYNKYQSFFYWLHFGFKGGIKSITSSFTDLYYHNLRPQFISYA